MSDSRNSFSPNFGANFSAKPQNNKIFMGPDYFIKKKVSDYHLSKLIPNFFYHTPLNNNYYPTIVAARVTLSLTFLFAFAYYRYKRSLAKDRDLSKKYPFTLVSRQFIEYEKETILNEKLSNKKIIIN